MTEPKTVPKSRSGLKGAERERNFFGPPEKSRSRSRPLRPERNPGTDFWPPKVRWARERGWLRVQDPADGSWHEIYAKEAPSGYVRLAQTDRAERRHL